MKLNNFWYIAAESRHLGAHTVVARQILGEKLAIFRDSAGKVVALQDRCLHRGAPLSRGAVSGGRLACSYHGWVYGGEGQVVHVPSEGPGEPKTVKKCARRYEACEADDYIYVCLDTPAGPPFAMPHYREKGWKTIRLINPFNNNVTNCAENFVDIPHTVFVHRWIFRAKRSQAFEATIQRKDGSVVVRYRKETSNLGIFSRFLNPGSREICHTDSFHMPNVTSVEYVFGPKRHFIITSQSIPITDEQTLVYTDLTYDYGMWNQISVPIIRWQAQTIIDQDREILARQMESLKREGPPFTNTSADLIHLMIESIRAELEKGGDPRTLPEKSYEIEFWV